MSRWMTVYACCKIQCGSFYCLGFQNTGDLCQPNRRVFRQGSYVGLRELLPDVELQDDDRNLGVVRFEPMNHRRPERNAEWRNPPRPNPQSRSPPHSAT